MVRMRARMAAILGVAIALALPPRMALASEFIRLDSTSMSMTGISIDSDPLIVYPAGMKTHFLPYSEAYVDDISLTSAESGSSHSDLIVTEQEYTIDLNQFDAKLKFWVPTIQMTPTSTQTGIVFPNPYRSSSTVINGTITWPNNFYISGAAGGTGAWSFDGRFYDDNGYFYSKEDQFTINEHDFTGEIATDYASTGAISGTLTHDSVLGEGLVFNECAFPAASNDGYRYYFIAVTASRDGASRSMFKSGTQFYAYQSVYNYWNDSFGNGSALALGMYGWAYRNTVSGVVTINRTFDYQRFTLPADADMVGFVVRNKVNSGWSQRIVMTPPVLYMVDPVVEQTIETETRTQTSELKDTSGSDSILSGLTAGGVSGFNQKLGFLGQIGTVANTFNSSLTNASANSVVQFPGVVVQGITLIPAQGVDIWQNGLNAFEQPVKMVFTFAFVAAWVNGMKRLLDYQILGEPYSGEVQE